MSLKRKNVEEEEGDSAIEGTQAEDHFKEEDEEAEFSFADRLQSGLCEGVKERDSSDLLFYEVTEKILKDLSEKSLGEIFPDGVIFLIRGSSKNFKYIVINSDGIFPLLSDLNSLKLSMMSSPFKRYLEQPFLEANKADPRLDIVQEKALIWSALFTGTASFQIEGKSAAESLSIANEKLARVAQHRFRLKDKFVPIVIVDFKDSEMKWLFSIFCEWTSRTMKTLRNEHFSLGMFKNALTNPFESLTNSSLSRGHEVTERTHDSSVPRYVMKTPGFASGGSPQKFFPSPSKFSSPSKFGSVKMFGK